ncbi:MAG: tRNA-dihydrouridine synthase family protein [Alphaproteobacteria bacterium]|nr:tRNA-dihydrouridine synthase family protein [Alphaproteobacteria bacterium]
MTSFLGFKSNVFLAPMAGITDAPMRNIVYKKCGNKVNIVSEMVAINALSRKNAKTYKIADVRDEAYPVIVQLVGSTPELFADAAKLAQELGASGIDINMGCPVRKITTSGAGSALMKDINTAAQIIKTVKDAVNLQVSVKFRKGWDENSVNAVDFAKMCQDSGASYITIHGRTRTQGYSGTADW